MEKKRIERYKINLIERKNDKLKIDIDFELVHKSKINILDKVFTLKDINIKYDSSKNESPNISLNTLKGPSIVGFNLKQKHLREIKDILDGIEEAKDLKNKL